MKEGNDHVQVPLTRNPHIMINFCFLIKNINYSSYDRCGTVLMLARSVCCNLCSTVIHISIRCLSSISLQNQPIYTETKILFKMSLKKA